MYLLATVPPHITEKLDVIVNQKHTIKANYDLAGNIKNEFMIPDAKPIIWPLLDVLIKQWAEKYPPEFATYGAMSNQSKFKMMLFNTWVNFQKKHEFNPIHTHDGVFSFVIWHKVPFKMEDERARLPNISEPDFRAGMFAFFFSDPSGRITQEALPVDNSWEGKVALFPASLNHCVYPFYTSDEYRVSISGNIGFKI